MTRSGARRLQVPSAPAAIDTLEARLLLTTPDVLTPIDEGVVTDPTPEITWEAVDTATSYDLWVTSLETYETVLKVDGITGTSYTPAEGALPQGRIRIWVNANLGGGGTSGWSPASEAIMQAAPTIDGPVGVGARNLIDDNTPTITWEASKAADHFQIWVTDLTAKAAAEAAAAAAGSTDPIDSSTYATVYTVDNFSILQDENGNDVLDAFGNPVHQEVRSFVLPDDATKTGSAGITFDPGSAIDTATENITWTDHGLLAGAKLNYSSGGDTAIGGLTTDTDYYVIVVDADTIQLAESHNDALAQVPVDLTDVGTGTSHRLSVVNDPRILDTGRYRLWMRSVDLSGRVSAWGAGFTLDVGARPENLIPDAPSFQPSPLLEWDSVERATHYEIYVARDGGPSPYFRRTVEASSGPRQSAYIIQSNLAVAVPPPIVDNGNGIVEPGESPRLDADGNEVMYNIETGTYMFWVRAVNMGDGVPTVYGQWSAASSFGTLTAPTVTGPVLESGYVTSARPTIEWTKIHGAARYEVLIHEYDARPPYLEANSTDTSYTLPEDLPAGRYTIWVRGLDTRGNASPWSDAYFITATGGRPVVTAIPGSPDPAFWTFSWIGVAEADTYEIWVSQDGVDFTFINVDAITGTTYDPAIPFNPGTHRVWVRAVAADGTEGPWSYPVTFVVAEHDAAQSQDPETLLASISVKVELNPQTVDSDERQVPPKHVPAEPVDLPNQRSEVRKEAGATPAEVIAAAVPATEMPTDALQQLAENCVEAQWWGAPDESV